MRGKSGQLKSGRLCSIRAPSAGLTGADESLNQTDVIQAPEIHPIRVYAANAGEFHLVPCEVLPVPIPARRRDDPDGLRACKSPRAAFNARPLASSGDETHSSFAPRVIRTVTAHACSYDLRVIAGFM